jgi:transcription initiation factor TFIIH subunit 1
LGRSGGKAAATRAQAREVLASLNHHAEVVLRGRPEGSNLRVADARSAALAAEAQERAGGARASLREAGEAERMQRELVIIDDLVDEAEAPMKTLDIADPSVYFAASDGGERRAEAKKVAPSAETSSSSGRKRKANEDEAEEGGAPPVGRSGSPSATADASAGFEEAVRAAARWMGVPLEPESEQKLGASPETSRRGVAAVKAEPGPESTPAAAFSSASASAPPPEPLVDPAAARGALDDLVASIRREAASRRGGWGLPADRPPGGGGGKGGDVDSSGSDAEAAADAAAAAELLRHFWTGAPMTTAARWEKAARVNAALGELYDRTEARKRETRDGAARHAYARKTKPLADAMDAAFAFFDDEKARRKAAWDAYERGALEKAERERKQREREGGEVVVVE